MNNEQGRVIASGTIRFQRILPGPIERIWEYLTDSEKRGKWLASGEMELRIGGSVTLNFLHADLSPEPESVPERYKKYENGEQARGRITRCEPPNVLSFTWDEASGEPSEVTFELQTRGEEVLLTLTHRRLGDDPATMLSVAAGWHTHLDILVDQLEGRVPRPFWSTHVQIEKEYQPRLALR